jgi:hypothetical protein
MNDDTDGGLNLDAAMEEVAEGIDFESGPDDDAGSPLESNDASGAPNVSRETTQQSTASDELPMPQSWKKEWENDWKATPQTSRQRFMEREKQMLDGLEQYKGDAGYGKALREVFHPYSDFLKSQGVDEPKAVQYLLNAHYRLTTGTIEDKRAYWSGLAKSYGLDAPAAAPNAEGAAQPLPQEVQDALTRLARIEGNLSQREQYEKQQRTETTKKQVDEFADDPAHPYFDECGEHITRLIKAGYGIQEAYETAVYANPVTRAKELQRLQTDAATALKEKAKQTATARRKATSVNVNPTSTSRTPTEGPAKLDDLDSVLRETAAEMRARAH